MSPTKLMCMTLLCSLSYLSLLPADKTALVQAVTTIVKSQHSAPVPPLNLQKIGRSKSADDIKTLAPSSPLEKVTLSQSAEYLEKMTPRSQTEQNFFPLHPKISPNKKLRDLLAAFS